MASQRCIQWIQWLISRRWRTCGICTFVVRTKHDEGMQGNDLRVNGRLLVLVFVFDGICNICMYLLVMQHRIGLLWNLQQGRGKLSAVFLLGDIHESLGHGCSIVPLLKRSEVSRGANDESVHLLKLLRLGAMDHAAATGFYTICSHWSFIAHRNIHWFLGDFCWHLLNAKPRHCTQKHKPMSLSSLTSGHASPAGLITANGKSNTCFLHFLVFHDRCTPWAKVHPELQRGSLWSLPHRQGHPRSHGSRGPHYWEVCGLGGWWRKSTVEQLLAWVENILLEEKKSNPKGGVESRDFEMEEQINF